MINSLTEKTYKTNIQPANWVPREEADYAQVLYSQIANRFLKQRNKSSFDKIHLQAIESLVTDEGFEKFWKKASKRKVSNIMVEINGIFTTHHFSAPSITKAEKKKDIEDCIAALKKIVRIIKSDLSVFHEFDIAFLKAVKEPNHIEAAPSKSRKSGNCLTHIERLIEALSVSSPTHQYYPRSLKEKNKGERVYFEHRISELVQRVYGSPNYAETAKILNMIRPDLGVFEASNIRKVLSPKKKQERSKKK